MRTVEKALRLLDYFDEHSPELGLSGLARASGIDKATVLRMLTSMAETGLVEQDSQSKTWRLGAGLLRLARLREASFPVTRVLSPILERLAETTGETAHASLISGRDLGTVGAVEPARSNRVYIEPGLVLPLHATASGLAYTAFARPEIRAKVLTRKLGQFTETTPHDPATLDALLDQTRARGIAFGDQTFEDEVFGLATPLFDAQGFAFGALALASPASRINDAHISSLAEALTAATREATQGLGGCIPSSFPIT